METRSNTLIWKLTVQLVTALLITESAVYAASAAGSGSNHANKMASTEKRDPFWPVDYVPERIKNASLNDSQRALQGTNGKQDWNAAMKQVVINGVSSRSNNECFAVINGQVKSVGETVSVSFGGMNYTWIVDHINTAGSVKLRQLSVK